MESNLTVMGSLPDPTTFEALLGEYIAETLPMCGEALSSAQQPRDVGQP